MDTDKLSILINPNKNGSFYLPKKIREVIGLKKMQPLRVTFNKKKKSLTITPYLSPLLDFVNRDKLKKTYLDHSKVRDLVDYSGL